MGDESVIHEFLVSKDLDFSITGFSWNLIEDTRHLYTTRWPMVDYVISNPLVTLDEESLEMFKMYELQKQRIARSTVSLFKEELIHNAVQSEIYEFIRGINGEARPHTTADEGRGNQILRDFLDILYAGHGRIHTVSEISEILSLTPKYLSRVIKEETGLNPLAHIHQYMTDAIKQELQYTDKTIKEISVQLKFSSVAFFGKYVKEQTGYSPIALRERLRNKIE